MAIFPSTLPDPLLSGYSVAPTQGFVRSEVETGPARQRKRYSATPAKVTLKWIFTAAQMVTFRNFFNSDINKGASWFDIYLNVGDGYAPMQARFSTQYSAALLGANNWEVSGSLEVNNV
jgi:hypothetical protein